MLRIANQSEFWRRVEHKYPKAWDMLFKWCDEIYTPSPAFEIDDEGLVIFHDGVYFQIDSLFHFFDKNKIMISMTFNVQSKFEGHVLPGHFWYDIDPYNGEDFDGGSSIGMDLVERMDAYYNAFDGAFEILENRLLGEQNG